MAGGIAKTFAGFDDEVIRGGEQEPFREAYLPRDGSAGGGRIDEARIAANVGMPTDSSFTIQRYQAGAPSDNPIFVSGRERVYGGHAKGGFRGLNASRMALAASTRKATDRTPPNRDGQSPQAFDNRDRRKSTQSSRSAMVGVALRLLNTATLAAL
jgi:hypothetical protein